MKKITFIGICLICLTALVGCAKQQPKQDYIALFGGAITQSMADSLFATDPRIRFVYIDFYE